MRIVVVGLGGIGTNLIEPLCRMVTHTPEEQLAHRVILVDGDVYELKNQIRQRYEEIGNKAQETRRWLLPLFPGLIIEAKPHYIKEDNIFALVTDGDIVLLGVDNHATRKLIAEHAAALENVLVISGGNEEYDGNVQVHWRKEGIDLTPPLTWRHPEIENPQDRNPGDLACGELVAAGATQVLAINLTIASLMLNILTLWVRTWREQNKMPFCEIYCDLLTGRQRPVPTPQDLT